MSDEPDKNVLDFLRASFARVDTKLDRITDGLSDLQRRMTTLETQVGNLAATEQSHYANTMLRLDGFSARLERIERRYELIDAPVVP